MRTAYSHREQHDVTTHFQFGQNWYEYAQTIDATRLAHAKKRLSDLVPDLAGKTFLDIGCGSGLHSLAAHEMGAAEITAFDFDPLSVETTRAVLGTVKAHLFQGNILEPVPELQGKTFDIVYSWGVLHHTGAMWDAITNAARFVKPGGVLAIALYQTTRMDAMWVVIKRLYSRLPAWARWPITYGYMGLYLARIVAKGQNPVAYVASYKCDRGMSWKHDVVDWLGGYPYETAAPHELESHLQKAGFSNMLMTNVQKGKWGFFGSGCAEYVFHQGVG